MAGGVIIRMDASFLRLVMNFQEALNKYIPPHMHGALVRYIEDRIEPGGFLGAVLQNNLKEAIGRGDHLNLNKLPDYVTFLYNHAPSGCWGSPEKVFAWLRETPASLGEAAAIADAEMMPCLNLDCAKFTHKVSGLCDDCLEMAVTNAEDEQ
jgi:hypothetical protein